MFGSNEIGGPVARLRVRSAYATSSFGSFIPPNKSVPAESLVGQCRGSEETTWGEELLDLGHGPVRLHSQSFYAPYRVRDIVHPRVISFLMPVAAPAPSPVQQVRFDIEST
jgi:hypothetical protein